MLLVKYACHMDVRPLNKLNVAKEIEIPDEDLMLAYAQKNDQQAFALLYTRHKSSLYRYCVRMVGNEALGAELFQDAWSKVIKARERYKPSAKFKTYLFHVAHNLIIDHWRKHRPDMLSVDDDENFVELESSSDFLDELNTAEKIEQFRQAVLQLPPKQRNVLLLHYDSGLTLEQIATLDGLGRETVKSRLRYAMKKLKMILADSELHAGYMMSEVSHDR